MINKVGPLQWQVPIVDREGRPTPDFNRYFQQLFGNTTTLDGTKQDASDNLTAISAITDEGVVVRTGDSTFAVRDIAATAPIAVADGDGIAANPTISHNDSGVTAGSYGDATHVPQITVDAKGHVTAVSSAAVGGGGNAFELSPTIPLVTNFTFQNQGTATATDTSTGLYVYGPSVGTNIRFLKFTAGVSSFTSFTITCRGSAVEPFYDGGYSNCLILRNSSSGKIVIFGNYQRDSQMLAQNWTNYTTFSAGIYGPHSIQALPNLLWRRIRVTGGNIIFEVSPDGVNWGTFYNSVTVASFMTSINEVGLGIMETGTNCATVFNSFTAV